VGNLIEGNKNNRYLDLGNGSNKFGHHSEPSPESFQ